MPALTEAAIRRLASGESFRRGRACYETGAVLELERRGDRLVAEVAGSRGRPYRVRVTLGAEGVAATECDCPYDWGGCCKHVVAVLLACANQPEGVVRRPIFKDMIADLDREQLRQLLLKLVAGRPALADVVEGHLLTLKGTSQAGAAGPQASARRSRNPLDPTPYRRQARRLLQSYDPSASDAYRRDGEVIEGLREVLEQAQSFLAADDGDNALIVLETLTAEYLAGWTRLDGSSGEAGDFWLELSPPWAEALLSVELGAAEREAWVGKLRDWQTELEDYGVGEALDPVIAAAETGWDDPELQLMLAGKASLEEVSEAEEEDDANMGLFGDDLEEVLPLARLNVLARQGRTREYLNLAAALGQTERYATMLVKSGRPGEAVAYGLTSLSTADEALALARALRERDELASALRVGEHGLALEAPRDALAGWLRDVARDAGRPGLALRAAETAFAARPGLGNYQAVAALAGEEWPRLRSRLLARLGEIAPRDFLVAPAAIDIYLHEGLVVEAVTLAEREGFVGYATLARVAEAAIETHPDWVIAQCRKQAERIIDPGKSRLYHHAVRWLERARAAYLAAGRETEWDACLEALLTRHHRKYSLVPRLKELG